MSILTDIAKWFKPTPLPGPIQGQSASVYEAFQSGVAKPGDTISAPKVNIGNLGAIGQQSKSGKIRQPIPVTGVATSPYSSATTDEFLPLLQLQGNLLLLLLHIMTLVVHLPMTHF